MCIVYVVPPLYKTMTHRGKGATAMNTPPMTWRLLRNGDQSPAMNMAVDEALMYSVGQADAPPTLRLYGWNPPTLSIGYFQRATSVNLQALQAQRIGFVRRPTGGRAVLHAQEVTYAIVVKEGTILPSSISASYRMLSEGIAHALRALGLDAEMATLPSSSTHGEQSSAACFDAPSWHELVVDGKKVAGSAQWRQHGALLQHGSILLDHNIEQLFSLLAFRSPTQRMRMQQLYTDHATTINEQRQKNGCTPMTKEAVEAALLCGWGETLHAQWHADTLSEDERMVATHRRVTKYEQDAWNLRK